MTPRRAPVHRDTKIVLAALIVGLIVSWAICIHRLREIKEQNLAMTEGIHSGNWPCEYDAKQFCSDIPRGEGRVNACLEEHENSLTPACADYRDMTDGTEDWVLACDPELHGICFGQFHQMDCLKANWSTLSKHCVSRIRRYEYAEKWRRACFDDAARLCPGLSGDQAKDCLTQHAQDLGTSCRIYYSTQNASPM